MLTGSPACTSSSCEAPKRQDGLAVAELVLDELHGVAVLRQRGDRLGAVGQHQRVEQEAGLVLQRGVGIERRRRRPS